MIAYRQQYEPMNRQIVKMIKEGRLGTVKSFIATNGQDQGDPSQWRQKLALAGGGSLPDVGIYCFNAARFLTNEEPSEAVAFTTQPTDDPRFREVEETCGFTLRFPQRTHRHLHSPATVSTAPSSFASRGTEAWAELSPAFAYTGLKLKTDRTEDGRDVLSEPSIEAERSVRP